MSNKFSYKQFSFKFYAAYGLTGFLVYYFWKMISYSNANNDKIETLSLLYNLIPFIICIGIALLSGDEEGGVKFVGNTKLFRLKFLTMIVSGVLGLFIVSAVT